MEKMKEYKAWKLQFKNDTWLQAQAKFWPYTLWSAQEKIMKENLIHQILQTLIFPPNFSSICCNIFPQSSAYK